MTQRLGRLEPFSRSSRHRLRSCPLLPSLSPSRRGELSPSIGPFPCGGRGIDGDKVTGVTIPPWHPLRVTKSRRRHFQNELPLVGADRRHRQARLPQHFQLRELGLGFDLRKRHRLGEFVAGFDADAGPLLLALALGSPSGCQARVIAIMPTAALSIANGRRKRGRRAACP